jgi:hypothetical protein
VGTRLGGTLRRPAPEHTLENKEEAVSYAAYRTLVDLFPGRASLFEALMDDLGYAPTEATTDPSTPAGVGNTVAAVLLAFRHADGSDQLNGYADYTGYAPRNPPMDPTEPGGVEALVDPGKWQPLIHSGQVQRWIIPHWRYVTPFALTSAEQFLPPPPAAVGSGEFRRQVQEVINLQARLTDRQKVIAEYWADGPSSEFPPGHWCTISQYVSRRNGHTLDEDVKLFLARHRAMIASKSTGTSGRSSRNGRASTDTTRSSVSCGDSPWNGGLPASISKPTAPSPLMSVAPDNRCDLSCACSGAM